MWRLIPILFVCYCAIGCDKPTDTSSTQSVANVGQDKSAPVSKVVIPKDETSGHHGTHELVTNAINREDWVGLKKLTRQGMKANESIEKWKLNPIRVGEFKSVRHDAEFDGKPCTSYLYEMQYKDGKLHPHGLAILVREDDTQSELLDFYEFGW